jgi:ABC-type Fe3+-siderophore transport system permease subunit
MQPSPVAPLSSEASALDRLAPQMWTRLAEAQRWVRVIATLLVIAGLLLFGLGLAGTAFLALEDSQTLAQITAALAAFVACLFLIPSAILFRYAARLQNATKTRAISHLAAAFRVQERFWTYASGLIIVFLVLWLISDVLHALHPELAG